MSTKKNQLIITFKILHEIIFIWSNKGLFLSPLEKSKTFYKSSEVRLYNLTTIINNSYDNIQYGYVVSNLSKLHTLTLIIFLHSYIKLKCRMMFANIPVSHMRWETKNWKVTIVYYLLYNDTSRFFDFNHLSKCFDIILDENPRQA